jgi:hypothetical protein
MSSSVRDITESTEAEGRDDTHQVYVENKARLTPPLGCRGLSLFYVYTTYV